MDRNPVTNPQVQEALSRKYSNRTLILLPLDNGDVAVFDRGFNLHMVLDSSDESMSFDQMATLSKVFHAQLMSRTAEARYYGEPDDRSYAKDLKNGRTPPKQFEKKATRGTVVDIEL
jgi:hypothetical protein